MTDGFWKRFEQAWDARVERATAPVLDSTWVNNVRRAQAAVRDWLDRVFLPERRMRVPSVRAADVAELFELGVPARANDGYLVGVERGLPDFEEDVIVYVLRPVRHPARITNPEDWALDFMRRCRADAKAVHAYQESIKRHEGLATDQPKDVLDLLATATGPRDYPWDVGRLKRASRRGGGRGHEEHRDFSEK